MKVSRREFLILTAGFTAGCSSTEGTDSLAARKQGVLNAGLAANYAGDGVYGALRDRGVFIIRHGDKLVALSAICTHKNCKLKAEKDDSFYCPCHGSKFDPAGHVTKGPAKLDLPTFPTSVDDSGHLLITIQAT